MKYLLFLGLCMLTACALLAAGSSADHGPLSAHVAAAVEQPRSRCTVNITGSAERRRSYESLDAIDEAILPGCSSQGECQRKFPISSATVTCEGDPVVMAVHKTLLGPFSNTFQGFQLDAGCQLEGCLLTICRGSRVILEQSVIERAVGIKVALCVRDNADVVLDGAHVVWNNASGIVAFNQSKLQVTGRSVIGHNLVVVDPYTIPGKWFDDGLGAGLVPVEGSFAVGVSAVDHAHIVITGDSEVVGNTGLMLDNITFGKMPGSRYPLFEWPIGAGGLMVRDSARMEIIGQLSEEGLQSIADSELGVAIHKNLIDGNCGGAIAAGKGALSLKGRVHFGANDACWSGGGLCARDNATLATESGGNVTIRYNGCRAFGCGLFAAGRSSVVLDGNITIAQNATSPNTSQWIQCSRWSNVRGRGSPQTTTSGGVGVAVGGTARVVLGSGVHLSKPRRGDRSDVSSVYAFGNGSLMVNAGVTFVRWSLGLFDTATESVRVRGVDITTAQNALLYLGEGVSVLQGDELQLMLRLQHDLQLMLQLQQLASRGQSVFRQQRLAVCNASVLLDSSMCPPGTYSTARGCACCTAYTYDFSRSPRANASCFPCPDNAVCQDNQVVPLEGFWHSSKQSVQMHKCPIARSCLGNDTCATGHAGNLCGACAPGYGITVPFRCSKCQSAPRQLLLYMGLFLASVLLITYTAHATWQDNMSAGQGLRVSDLLKVPVQFLQYLVIFGSISVPWPGFLTSCFAAASVVFGAAAGQTSLDCWVKQHFSQVRLATAIQRQLVLAVVMLLVVLRYLMRLALSAAAARRNQNSSLSGDRHASLHLFSRLRVAAIVVVFFAYPTLVKASLSFFACLKIDYSSNKNDPFPEYAVKNHAAGYWVSDIQQECFAGWHRAWAFGLGIPAVALFCVGMPVGLWLFMWRNSDRAAEPTFQQHYGFLFRNFRDSCLWWEAVWAGQTVMLSLVSVFHHSIGAYHALLLMLLFLVLSIVLQLCKKPYEHLLLHRLHLAATCCLLANIWLAQNMFTLDNAAVHVLLGVVMILVDAVLLGWCVYHIVLLSHATIKPVRVVAAWLRSRTCCGVTGKTTPAQPGV